MLYCSEGFSDTDQIFCRCNGGLCRQLSYHLGASHRAFWGLQCSLGNTASILCCVPFQVTLAPEREEQLSPSLPGPLLATGPEQFTLPMKIPVVDLDQTENICSQAYQVDKLNLTMYPIHTPNTLLSCRCISLWEGILFTSNHSLWTIACTFSSRLLLYLQDTGVVLDCIYKTELAI